MTTGDAPEEPASPAGAGGGPAASGTSPAEQLNRGALTGEWQLDPGRSSVTFGAKNFWGLATVRGRFTEISGDGVVGPDGTVTGQVVLDARSVDTRNAKRDRHLRSHDFFNVDEQPNITLTVTGIRPAGANRVEMAGQLRIAGQTRQITVPATVEATDETTVSFVSDVDIDRTEYGMTWNMVGSVSKRSVIHAETTFTRSGA
jgi:polyisoprenoid-binding protein YceI